jgi:hypothetical protein
MGNETAGEPHRQRRGADKVNPIQKSKRELRIRLVYPPFVPTSSADQPFQIKERPAKNMDYSLKAGGEEYKGTTDGEGVLRQVLPVDVDSASLTLFVKVKGQQQTFWQLDLLISDLDGCPGRAGAKARLNNLGLFGTESVDLGQDDHKSGGDENYNPYLRALERFTNLFGPAPVPQSIFDEKAAWARIKEIHGG